MQQGEHFERKKGLAVFLSLIMLGAIAVAVFKAVELISLLGLVDLWCSKKQHTT